MKSVLSQFDKTSELDQIVQPIRSKFEPDAQSELDQLLEFICVSVWGGFTTPPEIVREVIKLSEGGRFKLVSNSVGEATLLKITECIYAKKLEVQENWPASTTYDQLHLAFLVLSSSGIACLEIADEYTKKNWEDFFTAVEFYWDNRGPLRELFGGCFFQQEDLERAVNEEPLRLSFCAKVQSEIEVVAYGITAELEKRGLSPVLKLAEQEILLSCQWQKRSTTGHRGFDGSVVY
ncbi:hypothetical protein BH10CYA1_BH10CYA1_12210 [soil metagenome]